MSALMTDGLKLLRVETRASVRVTHHHGASVWSRRVQREAEMLTEGEGCGQLVSHE